MKILVSRKARSDLLQIYSYVGQRNPRAAEAIVHQIDRKFDQLTRFPFIGRERPSLAPELRSVLVGTHVIFYMVGSDRITVVRVIDGRRDIDEEFRR